MNEFERKKEQLEKYIEVKEQECDELTEDLTEANESIIWWTNRFNAIERDNKILQEKIDKAVKYIKECTSSPDKYERFISTGECKKLLDILKGDNK